ncbi:hypothetical protein GN244_ATG10087 [Phytophthora infestans]|uniref:Uncharacterized protein n=1 Tax=Phytophthora infestans TaxID=4787 RepID=A0A833WJF3_PHYIN|nr:hypothetical protein GN244_ATG10087 [Phytophthora infestans]
MAQCKTCRLISNLSAAGVDSKLHRVLLEDSVWSGLIAKADANTGMIQFEEFIVNFDDACDLAPTSEGDIVHLDKV